MGFAEQLTNLKPVYRGSVCLTCSIISELSPTDRDAINAAFDNPKITHADLWRVFKAEGYVITSSSIRRHRIKECRQL
jgi:hypothetical protein